MSKGTVGVWNGTTIKLFKVQETQHDGPSFLAPRGAVDALGTTLVETLGSVRRQVSSGGGTQAGAEGRRPTPEAGGRISLSEMGRRSSSREASITGSGAGEQGHEERTTVV